MASAVLAAGLASTPGLAQDAPEPESPDPPELAPPDYGGPLPDDEEAAAPEDAAGAAAERAAKLEDLYRQLADPDRDDWERVQTEIQRLWSRSGSPAMDLLLRRAGQEMHSENYGAAIDHLTALTELAPDFAEGWNARATAFYQMGEYSLAMADIEHALALNPRHFGALTGLGIILGETGQYGSALGALREAERINPNQPGIRDHIRRVERSLGAADL